MILFQLDTASMSASTRAMKIVMRATTWSARETRPTATTRSTRRRFDTSGQIFSAASAASSHAASIVKANTNDMTVNTMTSFGYKVHLNLGFILQESPIAENALDSVSYKLYLHSGGMAYQ